MKFAAKYAASARRFGSAIAMQGLISGANLMVGLILIRHAADSEYGYYVLTVTVILLATSLQNAFIQAHLVVRMTAADKVKRAHLVGGLLRSQQRLMPVIAIAGALVTGIAWTTQAVSTHLAYIGLAAIGAVFTAMYREFFRMVLFAYRRPEYVLKADTAYCALLVLFAYVAIHTESSAVVAILGLIIASAVGGLICASALWRYEPWNIRGATGILREIAPLGAWTAAGAAIHWLFSQGYNFLVAEHISAAAVAAIAATRILIQPIGLLSTGIGTLMLPTVSNWLMHHPARRVMIRQTMIAGGLGLVALFYFGLIWLSRDWIFLNILRKSPENRDLLLMLWFGVALLMLLRDQLVFLLLSRQRFRTLTVLTAVSAMVALSTSFMLMERIGVAGALVGVLVGEIINVGGLVILSTSETRKKNVGIAPPLCNDLTAASPRD